MRRKQLAEYSVLEDINASNYHNRRIKVTVDTDLVGLGESYEVNLFTFVDSMEHTAIFFDTVADFKKFVENLQTIVSEIEDAN
jgi:hypothetical protein